MKSSTRMILAAGAALIAGSITMSVAWSAPRISSDNPPGSVVTPWSVPNPPVSKAGSSIGGGIVAPLPASCPAAESNPYGCFPRRILIAPDGTPQGVTATGQGSVKGRGASVRDEAIREAVSDAREQAQTAAQAAGVKLGPVIDIRISDSGYPYPLAEGASGGAVRAVPAGPPIAVPAETFVSVTVTWSIAG